MKTKFTLSIITCAAVLVSGSSLSNAEDKGDGKGRSKGDGSFLKSMDKDGDNAISKEEAGDRWDRLGKLDKDEDGKVTVREMMAARQGGPGGPEGSGKGGPKGKPGEMFKRSDKNSDGKITKDEVPERAWEFLSKLDKNGDDAVSEEEAKAGRPPGGPGGPEGGRPDGSEMFKRADKNNDGKISKDEVPEQAWDRLGKLDKDGDDAVSREEMKAMAGGMGKGGKGKGGKGGAPAGGSGAMFDRFDENKDGKLAEDEVPAEMWAKVRKADSDADGLVSKGEMEKVMSMRDGGKPEATRPDAKKKKRPALETEDKSA